MNVTALRNLVTKTRSTAGTYASKGYTMFEKHYGAMLKENTEFIIKDSEKESLLLKQWFFTKLSKYVKF